MFYIGSPFNSYNLFMHAGGVAGHVGAGDDVELRGVVPAQNDLAWLHLFMPQTIKGAQWSCPI